MFKLRLGECDIASFIIGNVMRINEQEVLLMVFVSKWTVSRSKFAKKARQAFYNLGYLNVIGIDVTTTVINPLSQLYTSNVLARSFLMSLTSSK